MAKADAALSRAIAGAKQAKTLAEACGGLGALWDQLTTLNQVMPPAGSEQAFSEERNGIFMLLDVMRDQRCDESSGADADMIRDELGQLRKEFVALQQEGAAQ